MSTFRNSALVAVVALTAAILTGCTPMPAPTETPSPTHTQSTPTPEPATVDVFWVSSQPTDFRLNSEAHSITSTESPVFAAVAGILDGSLQPIDPDYVNLWGHGSRLNSLVVNGSAAAIDITKGTLNVGASSEIRALQQLMFTVWAATPDVTEFTFTIDGKTAETLAGHVDLTVPLLLGDPIEALAAVQITDPVDGAVASNPVRIHGEACVFEANVAWELLSESDIVDSGSTLASEACPTRSPWTIDLGELDAGTYVIVVREMSAKDGSVVTEDSKTFVVE